MGRWLSCDPQGKNHGINLYMFVLGNVPNLIDRQGLAAEQSEGDSKPAPRPKITQIDANANRAAKPERYDVKIRRKCRGLQKVYHEDPETCFRHRLHSKP